MSLVAPIQRKPWIAIAAGLTLLIVLATTLLLIDFPGKHVLSGGGEEGGVVPEAAVPQAPWSIKAYPAGVTDKVTKDQAKVLEKRRPEVIALVKRVYDALFVHPGRLAGTLDENFSADAAAALRRSSAAISEPGTVATTFRSAQIGVQAGGGSRLAVASVTVRAARSDPEAAPLRHKATLWMERRNGGWKVIAFDVDQGPVAGETNKKDGGAKKKGKRK